REIPRHWYAPEYPIFIGEFATKFHRGWPDLRKADVEQVISTRLRSLAEKGYPAAFLWSARATDEATEWTQSEIGDTVAYLGARSGGAGKDVV
ncbi:MAG: hypothetical protein JNJ50_30760, partial [Acidobacteria bacterium]|nr:hypothetical protein [Acidobacteriota bacterium]